MTILHRKPLIGSQVLVPAVMLNLFPLITTVNATELKEQDVKSAVETWVRHWTMDAQPDATVKVLEPHFMDGRIVAYVAHLSPHGFCICGADDQVRPVYLYNPVAQYEPSFPTYKQVLRRTGVQTIAARNSSLSDESGLHYVDRVFEERASHWQDLIEGLVPVQPMAGQSRTSPPALKLDLTSQWRQGSPYNDLCPDLTPGVNAERTLAGCGAIALAQIMYYWKWPVHPQGYAEGATPRRYSDQWEYSPNQVPDPPPFSGTRWANPPWSSRLKWLPDYLGSGNLLMKGYWDVSMTDQAKNVSNDEAYLSAIDALFEECLEPDPVSYNVDFDSVTYNWTLLRDVHQSDGPELENAEVAKLVFHSGVAAQSRYGIWRTSSGSTDCLHALEAHFGYYPEPYYKDWAGEDSVEDFTTEVQWGRPVFLAGDCGGGHVWLGYGYDSTYDPNRMFLMNLGWGPNTAGVWFSGDCLVPPPEDPDDPTTAPCSLISAHGGFIAPHTAVQFVGGPLLTGTGSPRNPYFGLYHALNSAPDGTTLIFRAGSTHTYPDDNLVIDRPLTLAGYGVTIQVE